MSTTTKTVAGSQQVTNATLARHFVLAAWDAEAEGDVRLAEHLLEIAYDLFDHQ